MSKDIPQPNGNEAWLQEHFEARCPIVSASQFHEAIQKRRVVINELEGEPAKVRTAMRQALGVPDNINLIIFGEQPGGLNEPPLILGKRLLARYMTTRYGCRALEYQAVSDVIGSEKGMYRVEVPNPVHPSGKETINLVSGTKHSNTPAHLLDARDVNYSQVIDQLLRIYRRNTPNIESLVGKLYLEFGRTEQSYATAQNNLLASLERNLGLNPRYSAQDIDIDSLFAQSGGLDLLTAHWDEIINKASQHKNQSTRIPDAQEAPFYAFLKDVNYRPRIWYADESRNNYVATHPYKAKEVVGTFSHQDILEGKIAIALRAIPRALMMAVVFDGMITGGGAKYNQVAAPVFEHVFQSPYLPIAWMDLTNSNGQQESIIQYESVSLLKGEKQIGYTKAKNLIAQGTLGMLDLDLSIKGSEKQLVQTVLQQPDLETSQRVNLSTKYEN